MLETFLDLLAAARDAQTAIIIRVLFALLAAAYAVGIAAMALFACTMLAQGGLYAIAGGSLLFALLCSSL